MLIDGILSRRASCNVPSIALRSPSEPSSPVAYGMLRIEAGEESDPKVLDKENLNDVEQNVVFASSECGDDELDIDDIPMAQHDCRLVRPQTEWVFSDCVDADAIAKALDKHKPDHVWEAVERKSLSLPSSADSIGTRTSSFGFISRSSSQVFPQGAPGSAARVLDKIKNIKMRHGPRLRRKLGKISMQEEEEGEEVSRSTTPEWDELPDQDLHQIDSMEVIIESLDLDSALAILVKGSFFGLSKSASKIVKAFKRDKFFKVQTHSISAFLLCFDDERDLRPRSYFSFREVQTAKVNYEQRGMIIYRRDGIPIFLYDLPQLFLDALLLVRRALANLSFNEGRTKSSTALMPMPMPMLNEKKPQAVPRSSVVTESTGIDDLSASRASMAPRKSVKKPLIDFDKATDVVTTGATFKISKASGASEVRKSRFFSLLAKKRFFKINLTSSEKFLRCYTSAMEMRLEQVFSFAQMRDADICHEEGEIILDKMCLHDLPRIFFDALLVVREYMTIYFEENQALPSALSWCDSLPVDQHGGPTSSSVLEIEDGESSRHELDSDDQAIPNFDLHSSRMISQRTDEAMTTLMSKIGQKPAS